MSNISEDTTSRILKEAEEHFRLYGYNKTTIADIAKACAMSPANVYRFFSTKNDIVEAIARLWLSEVEERAYDITRRDISASEQLVAYISEIHQITWDRYIEEGRIHELCMVAINQHFKAVDEHLKTMTRILQIILQKGCDQGEFFITDVAGIAFLMRTGMVKFHHPYLVAEYWKAPAIKPARAIAQMMLLALTNPKAANLLPVDQENLVQTARFMTDE